MTARTRELAIEELPVGAPLTQDIIDPEGRVLMRRGHVLLQHVVDRWTSKGFSKVLVSEEEVAEPLVERPASLTRDYDPALVEEVAEIIDRAQAALSEMIFDIAVRSEPRLGLLEKVSEALSKAIGIDSDIVAAQANMQIGRLASGNEALMRRSAAMATLATTTAIELGFSSGDCLTVALAGILHDISMYEETQAMILGERPTEEERSEAILRHPHFSADMLGKCRAVSEQVRVVVTQVHEQVDGSGFPRGISGHLMSIHARLLNLIDAFLTLTDPNQSRAFVPADALAYLAGQTSRGAFDRDCMRALLKTLSVYSVGSRVMLDDNSTAVVLRSSRTDPLRPVVRIDGSHARIVDLRNSNLAISSPAMDLDLPNRRRLRRAELKSVLWKPKLSVTTSDALPRHTS